MAIRTISLIAPVFLLSAAAVLAQAPKTASGRDAEDQVKVSVTASADTLRQGTGAELLILFSPRKGFHVNAVPPVAVAFDSSSPAREEGKLSIPSDSSTGYLKSALPVRRPFRLAQAAGRGRAELKGVLTYYYCSDAEGWCRKETMPFALTVVVR